MSHILVHRLRRSKIYNEHEGAFRETTCLPLDLRAAEAFELPQHGEPNESRFCALMTQSNRSGAACLQLQKRIEDQASLEPKTLRRFTGPCDSAGHRG